MDLNNSINLVKLQPQPLVPQPQPQSPPRISVSMVEVDLELNNNNNKYHSSNSNKCHSKDSIPQPLKWVAEEGLLWEGRVVRKVRLQSPGEGL